MKTEELIAELESLATLNENHGILTMAASRLRDLNGTDVAFALSYIYEIRCIVESTPGKMMLSDLLAEIRRLKDAQNP